MNKTILPLILLTFNVLIVKSQNEQRYDSLKIAYQKGKKNCQDLPWLATTAREMKDISFADMVAQDYLRKCIPKLTENQFLQKRTIELIRQFNKESDNTAFKKFSQHIRAIDSVMSSPGYALSYVLSTIGNKEIDPLLWQNKTPITDNPDWQRIQDQVAKKHGTSLAERATLEARINWFDRKKDTAGMLSAYVQKYDRYGIDSSGMGRVATNNVAYYLVFLYTNDPVILEKAVSWMSPVLQADPGNPSLLDTYANLLYKLGRKQEAIAYEHKASSNAPRDTEIQANYEKMKKGERTW